MQQPTEKIAYHLRQVLETLSQLGWEFTDEELANTPHRIARWWVSWATQSPPRITTFEPAPDELIVVKDVSFASLCSHHLVPYQGKASLAYLPDKQVIGLSKIPRIITYCAQRPTIQEGLTQAALDLFVEAVKPRFALLLIEATHGCVSCRGALNPTTRLVTNAIYLNPQHFKSHQEASHLKQEALRLINGR